MDKDLFILKTILRQTQDELYNFLVKFLKIKYDKVDCQESRTYIAAEGDIPIVLIAHLDTVFIDSSRKNMVIFYDQEKKVMWSPNGLGTDDRAGVAMILKLLNETELRPHILFTTHEESDAEGACEAAVAMPFKKINYCIELDRQGYNDSVYYDCDNKEFEKYINNFGFCTQEGTFTDISIICPEWKVAGVNLSVGYCYEHSYIEHFAFNSWYETYNKLCKMLIDKGNKHWKYIPAPILKLKEE